jgi:hypothetical protein
MPKMPSYSEFWANPYYNGTTLLKEPQITCNNCPDADECPGFDGCFYLAANCPKKKGSKRNG